MWGLRDSMAQKNQLYGAKGSGEKNYSTGSFAPQSISAYAQVNGVLNAGGLMTRHSAKVGIYPPLLSRPEPKQARSLSRPFRPESCAEK